MKTSFCGFNVVLYSFTKINGLGFPSLRLALLIKESHKVSSGTTDLGFSRKAVSREGDEGCMQFSG